MAPVPPPFKLMGGLGETAQLTNHTSEAKVSVVGLQMSSSFLYQSLALLAINN